MKVMSSMAGGLAGALSVTVMQELLKRVDPSAPRVDLLRKQAAFKIADRVGNGTTDARKINGAGLAGEIISNTLYFSLTAAAGKKAIPFGILLGSGMGAGAITLPSKLGLNPYFSGGTRKRKLMTMGMYLVGGLVAAAISRCLNKK